MIEKNKEVNVMLSGNGLDLNADRSVSCIKQFTVEPGLPASSLSCAVVNTFSDNMAIACGMVVLGLGLYS